MRIRVTVVVTGHVELEVDDAQRVKIENLECPLDINDFETATDIFVDTEEALSTGRIEIDDIDFLPERKTTAKEPT
jgi:hypothetical protein